jgi:threonine dehydratase
MMLPFTPTPLVRLGNLFPDRQVYAKCEFVSLSGSFKTRGAAHLLEKLSRSGGTRKLIVPSMGNTALGAAIGARAYGFSMVGVVPQTISRAKDEKLSALGVELVKLPVGGSALLHSAKQIARERDGYFVHPHLDPLWTDGYQAIAEEIFEALPDCKSLVFPVGGGGLLMGLTEYLLKTPREVKLYGCEAYNYPTYAAFTHARSATIADGLMLDEPHAKVQQRIAEMQITIRLLQDSEIRAGMRDLFAAQGLAVEPSSAITTAYIKAEVDKLAEPIGVVLTGENIAREDFFRLLGARKRRAVVWLALQQYAYAITLGGAP